MVNEERLNGAIGHLNELLQKQEWECEECKNEHATLLEMLQELKQYKDLEKQGLLLKCRCKVGDRVYCIIGDEYDGYEYVILKYMATCGDYILATSEYTSCKDFNVQLESMKEESKELFGVSIDMFEADLVFLTEQEAKQFCKENNDAEK